MREWAERRLVALFIIGGAMFLLAWPLLVMGLGSGSAQIGKQGGVDPLNVGLVAVGAICLFGGGGLLSLAAFTGLAFAATEQRGVRKTCQARVMARYAHNKQNEPVVGEWEYDLDTTRFYVRLALEGGATAEYRCPKSVFLMCGEGMVGEATYQGRWLGRFIPHFGDQPERVYERERPRFW